MISAFLLTYQRWTSRIEKFPDTAGDSFLIFFLKSIFHLVNIDDLNYKLDLDDRTGNIR